MKASQELRLTELAEVLVTPERYSQVQPVARLATVSALYPDTPAVNIIFGRFPEKAE